MNINSLHTLITIATKITAKIKYRTKKNVSGDKSRIKHIGVNYGIDYLKNT